MNQPSEAEIQGRIQQQIHPQGQYMIIGADINNIIAFIEDNVVTKHGKVLIPMLLASCAPPEQPEGDGDGDDGGVDPSANGESGGPGDG